VGIGASVALVADIPLSLAVGWRAGAAHLIAVGSAWMYNLLLKYTWASWTPYVLSFGLVPVIVADPIATPVTTPAAETVATAALFVENVMGRPLRTLPWSSVT